jgi:non-specific serine/threonine protein kinase
VESDLSLVLDCLGLDAWTLGDYAVARSRCEEALSLIRSAGAPAWVEIQTLYHQGLIAYAQMQFAEAESWNSQSLKLAEDAGELTGISRALTGLARVAHQTGDYGHARVLFERGVAKRREFGEPRGLVETLVSQGQLLLDTGDFLQAHALLEESITTSYERGDRQGIILALEAFASLAALTNQPEQAFRLVGAAKQLRARHNFPLAPTGRAQLKRRLEVLQKTVSEHTASELKSAGRVLSLEDAVALAHTTGAGEARYRSDRARGVSKPTRVLTAREHQVALLVGQGLTNRQIAERLVITERTAGAHIEHILRKLGYETRTQIGVWAAAHANSTDSSDEGEGEQIES